MIAYRYWEAAAACHWNSQSMDAPKASAAELRVGRAWGGYPHNRCNFAFRMNTDTAIGREPEASLAQDFVGPSEWICEASVSAAAAYT